MGFAARVNKKSRKNAYLPVLKYAELVPTVLHTISRVQRVTNEYGPTIVIDLNNEYSLFLPRRTVKSFDGEEGQEDFQALQEAVKANTVGFRKSADGISEFVDL